MRDVTVQLSAAARRSYSDWEYVIEGQDPITIILADAQFMRAYARLLAFKARYEAHGGDLPAAVGSLRDGLALGQHVADAPFLVNQLIGQAISDLMLGEVTELIEQPDAVNLYWALAELQRPLISFRRGAATERNMLELKFPELARLDDPNAPPDWQRLSRALRAWSAKIIATGAGIPETGIGAGAVGRTATAAQLAVARAYLRDVVQRPADEVDKMSAVEVEVRYSVALFHELGDTWRKWLFVSYPQALSRLTLGRSEELLDEAKRREIIPLASTLMPLSANFVASSARLNRQVARLQLIEALRMHAAAAGALPKALGEVTVVPVPLDPATGEPFLYTLDGDTATIEATDVSDSERLLGRFPTRIRLRGKSAE